jgi:hypothetical protein
MWLQIKYMTSLSPPTHVCGLCTLSSATTSSQVKQLYRAFVRGCFSDWAVGMFVYMQAAVTRNQRLFVPLYLPGVTPDHIAGRLVG